MIFRGEHRKIDAELYRHLPSNLTQPNPIYLKTKQGHLQQLFTEEKCHVFFLDSIKKYI